MSNIPTWVIVLFFVLLVIGIKACFARTMRVEKLIILPLIFVFLNIHGTFTLFGFDALMFSILLAGWVIGTVLGIAQIKNRVIQADKSKHLITVPGDVVMFFLVMGIFFIEFFIHYAIGAQWPIVKNPLFNPGAVFFSGLLAGLFIGRCGMYLYKYRHAQETLLK